jgi:transcriptional regulator with PAS, ATPase and Fis domain
VLTTGTTISRDAVTFETTSRRTVGVPSLRLHENVEWAERETIRQALQASPGKRHAATLMGISARALSYYLSKYPFLDKEQGTSHHCLARMKITGPTV